MKKRWSNSSKVPVFSGSLLRKRLARFFPSRSIIASTFSGHAVLLLLSLSALMIHADIQRIELVSGDVYEGDFQNGDFHGWGKFTSPDGTTIREGIWVDGEYSEKLTNMKKVKDFWD